jgi:hypothetical protein
LPLVVLAAEQPEDPWYLIRESELQSFEEYKMKSEQDKANWLSQVQKLKIRAESLEMESANLNRQLANERTLTQNWSKSFNEYEQENLKTVSLKNGEIATLTSSVSAEKLKTQKARTLNVILGGIIALFVIVSAIKLYLKIKTGGIGSLLKFFQP